jgi:arabinogalactan oligomer/maltooligosaccharide transport system permease protein
LPARPSAPPTEALDGDGDAVSTVEQIAEIPVAETRRRRAPRRPKLKDTWWRHAVGILGALFALFPPAYVLSAAFNGNQSLVGGGLIPRHISLANFHALFSTKQTNTSLPPAHYARWFANTMLVAGTTAILTVLLSALAAYAFSRFRFRGRRAGMMFLLLIQMFPQLLLIVAIYLIVFHVGAIFGILGLNKLTALIIVYLGGALGVNTWLMKGFFDSIPRELDESARVDGATPAQIFWGVVLPLAVPVLAVIALFSFITTINEFAIASALLQTTNHYTLPLGLYQFVNQEYGRHWGPFAAGVVIAALPAALIFAFLQRYIVSGLTQGSVKG